MNNTSDIWLSNLDKLDNIPSGILEYPSSIYHILAWVILIVGVYAIIHIGLKNAKQEKSE